MALPRSQGVKTHFNRNPNQLFNSGSKKKVFVKLLIWSLFCSGISALFWLDFPMAWEEDFKMSEEKFARQKVLDF